MPRKRDRPHALEAKNCYVGQTVYWIMWYDPEAEVGEDGKYSWWYRYRPELTPEIWKRKIERLTPRTIVLEGLGKTKVPVYASAQDAITAKYETFCFWEIGRGYATSRPKATLGEASAFLQKLSELEFNLNAEIRFEEKITAQNDNDN